MRSCGSRGTLLGSALLLALLLTTACGGASAPSTAARPAQSSAASAPASGQAAQAPAPIRVRSAYVSISGSQLPAWLGVDEGIFARHGLDVELSYIAGAVKMAEAVLAGEIDLAVTAAQSAMGPGLEGADTVMVASWTNKLAFSAVVGPAIQSVADFRGKRVGTVRRGSNSEVWATAILGRFGLEPDRDYTVVAAGGQPEQIAALHNGALDAAVLVPPSNLVARKLGHRELLSAREYGIEYANVGLVATRRYLRDNPEAVDRYLRAAAEAVALSFREPEVALASIARYTKTDDREALEETLSFEQGRIARDLLPTPAGLRAALDELVSTNPKAATANPDDFADLTAARRLTDSGYIAGLYP